MNNTITVIILLLLMAACGQPHSTQATLSTTAPPPPPNPYQLDTTPHKPIIVIDAGHGGRDPGAVNDSLKLYEKNITLKIVKELAKIIDTNKVRLILTRKHDTTYNRHDRITYANLYKPDLLLTIHVNEQRDTTASGFEINYNDTLLKAVQPNGDSIKVPNPYKPSLKLHTDVISKYIALSFPKMRKRNVVARKDDIWLLYAGHYPSILVEFGFISNRADLAYLTDDKSLKKLANAICKSIYAIFKLS